MYFPARIVIPIILALLVCAPSTQHLDASPRPDVDKGRAGLVASAENAPHALPPLLWSKQIGDSTHPTGPIAVNRLGDIYVGGYVTDTESDPVRALTDGKSDLFVARYDASGTQLANPVQDGTSATDGAVGISFGAGPNRGLIGGQRADNLIVSEYRSLD